MKETECAIGRENKDDPKYFCLDPNNNTISKLHARIAWDPLQGSFTITNYSKNKVRHHFSSISSLQFY